MVQDKLKPALLNGSSSKISTSQLGVGAMPDPSRVHVLYAGNLADDDFMWIVECTIEEFQTMLTSPVDWVRNLATLPDWPYATVGIKGPASVEVGAAIQRRSYASLRNARVPAPPPVLLKHFTMRVVQRERESLSDLITIQGVSHTGIITVRTSEASAVAGVRNLKAFRDEASVALSLDDDGDSPAPLVDDLGSFWSDLAYDPDNAPTYKKELAVNVHPSDDRYYAHFEITKPGEYSAAEMLAKTAAFVLAYGSDPQGFTDMLNSLDQTALYITPSGVVSGVPITLDMPSGAPPPLLYTNDDDSNTSCCNMLDGAYDSGSDTGIVDNPVVKRYGIGDDPGG